MANNDYYSQQSPVCSSSKQASSSATTKQEVTRLLADRAPLTLLRSAYTTQTNTEGKKAAAEKQPDETPTPQSMPLFWEPTPGREYAPVVGEWSIARENAYRNVGRCVVRPHRAGNYCPAMSNDRFPCCSLIGLALQQGEVFPLPLCRHVFKYLLGRRINWFDIG